MARSDSPYYPPRAGLGNRARRAWYSILRHTPIHLQTVIRTASGLLPALIVPGYGFLPRHIPSPPPPPRLRRNRRIIAAAVFLIWILCLAGWTLAYLRMDTGSYRSALALMTALHGASLSHHILTTLLPRDLCLRPRLAIALAITLGLFLAAYLPLTHLAPRIAIPLRTPDGVVVIDPRTSLADIRRGDTVAYRAPIRYTGYANRAIRTNQSDGAGVETVQALPGDRIQFFPYRLEVNGLAQPRIPGMPQSGEQIVPASHYYIWPAHFRARNNTGNAANLDTLLQQAALVPEKEIIGKPHTGWLNPNPQPQP
ncbi:hypothetical protein [Geminisphaera colitermitum]|uniref:hypothetical protein n=1 Tax=Geminisphaera colitermitum TaxID=1148786 RepID=UPI0005BB8BB8|nr:hypothetical protein [Geminisphaera colitermitum]